MTTSSQKFVKHFVASMYALCAALLLAGYAHAVCPVITEGGVQKINCPQEFSEHVKFGGTVEFSGGGGFDSMVSTTTAPLTYYVRTAGSDSNTCLTTGAACLTIQAALNKLPTFIAHAVSVDVGVGTFAGAGISNKIFSSTTAGISLTGTLIAATPATGPVSGTLTGGADNNCVDSSATWTANDLAGKLAYFPTHDPYFRYMFIYANDATSFTYGGFTDSCSSGEAYELKDFGTIIADVAAGFADQYAGIVVSGNVIAATDNAAPWRVTDLAIDVTQNEMYYGLWARNTVGGLVTRVSVLDGEALAVAFGFDAVNSGTSGLQQVYSTGSYTGVEVYHCDAQIGINASTFIGADDTMLFFDHVRDAQVMTTLVQSAPGGIVAWDVDNLYTSGVTLDDIGGIAVAARNTRKFELQATYIYGAAGHGVVLSNVGKAALSNVVIEDGSGGLSVGGPMPSMSGGEAFHVGSSVFVNGLSVSNSTVDGIIAYGPQTFLTITSLSGTGNTLYGVNLQDGAQAVLSQLPTITGVEGELTIDNGSTALDWSTDFATNLTYKNNVTTGTRVWRRDP